MERKIAFCVGNWSADSTLYSWIWAKQFFFRKTKDASGNELLSPLDQLFVVHVNTGRSKEKWSTGGPLLPNLTTALANYPHSLVELEGNNVYQVLLDFAERSEIDVVILGSREHRGTVNKVLPGNMGSVSTQLRQHARCPTLVVRPGAARNDKMRIKSQLNLGTVLEQTGYDSTQSLPPSVQASLIQVRSSPETRRVAIVFDHIPAGKQMMAWAAKYCLFPDDLVHIVHCINKKEAKEAKREAREDIEKGAESEPEDVSALGHEELQGYDREYKQLKTSEARQELLTYAEAESVDLFIVTMSSGSRLRQAFTRGDTAAYLVQHAPCPTLIFPTRAMAFAERAFSSDGGFDSLDEASPTHPSPGERHGVDRSKTLPARPFAAAAQEKKSPRITTASTMVRETPPTTPPRPPAAVSPPAGASPSLGPDKLETTFDLVSALKDQLSAKDQEIESLRAELARLRAAAPAPQ